MRILITGSEGVLGKYIKQYFRDRGFEVKGLDVRAGADYVVDVMNVEGLLAVREEFRPDVVVHFAALASPVESWFREVEYYDVNVLGTTYVARVFSNSLIVLASSCAVYGRTGEVKEVVREGDPTEPLSPYGLSKLMAEEVLELHGRERGLKYVVLRLGNVYSPYDDKYVFWKMWKQKRFVLRDPEAVRDFVSVYDLARLIERVIDVWCSGEEVNGVYNVGHEALKVGTVVEAFRDLTGRPEEVVVGSGLLSGEFRRMKLDWSRARERFGWEPRMWLVPEGIRWLAASFMRRSGELCV